MTMPSWVANSTAVSAIDDPCSGFQAAMVLTYPAAVSADDILLCIFNANSSNTADTVGFSGDATASPWSLLYETGAGTSRYIGVYYKIATGSEDSGSVTCTITFSGTTNSRCLSVIHQFTNASSTPDTTVGGANSGLSSTPGFASLTTNQTNSLAVGIMWANTSTTINSHVGETGGDWTEAAAEHTSAGNLIQVQTANMASIGTISGGNSSLGVSTSWQNYNFALEEVAATKSLPFIGSFRPFQHLLIR
jgi:hypothetical protein